MSDREELEQLLGEVWDNGNGAGLDGWNGPGRGAGDIDDEAVRSRRRDVTMYTSRIVSLFKPCMVTTLGQLTSLARGSVIRTASGTVLAHTGPTWWEVIGRSGLNDFRVPNIAWLPVEVLHEPEGR